MSVPHTLLGLLEVQPRHGYDLKRAYDARFGHDRPLKPGQVYATLGRLERDGFVVTAGTARDGGPDRTTYAVTPDGVTDLNRWFAMPEGPAPYLQSVLFAKVVLALQSGRDAAQVFGDGRLCGARGDAPGIRAPMNAPCDRAGKLFKSGTNHHPRRGERGKVSDKSRLPSSITLTSVHVSGF